MKAGDLRRTHEIIIYDAELLTRDVGDFKSIEGLKTREPY